MALIRLHGRCNYAARVILRLYTAGLIRRALIRSVSAPKLKKKPRAFSPYPVEQCAKY
jgi:hypothetical protein